MIFFFYITNTAECLHSSSNITLKCYPLVERTSIDSLKLTLRSVTRPSAVTPSWSRQALGGTEWQVGGTRWQVGGELVPHLRSLNPVGTSRKQQFSCCAKNEKETWRPLRFIIVVAPRRSSDKAVRRGGDWQVPTVLSSSHDVRRQKKQELYVAKTIGSARGCTEPVPQAAPEIIC